MLKFLEMNLNNPKLIQKHSAEQLGSSDSTVKSYTDQIIMSSTYNRKNERKKLAPKTSLQIQPKEVSKVIIKILTMKFFNFFW